MITNLSTLSDLKCGNVLEIKEKQAARLNKVTIYGNVSEIRCYLEVYPYEEGAFHYYHDHFTHPSISDDGFSMPVTVLTSSKTLVKDITKKFKEHDALWI